METISGRTCCCHIVALPYPGRGHINSMMNLCKLLASKTKVIITFVVTEEWLGFIGSEPKPHNIMFRSIPNVIPSELVRAADFAGFLEAILTKMEAPFEELLDQLEKPSVSAIIADTCLPWAVAVGNRRSIPMASLWPMSASVFSKNTNFTVDFSDLPIVFFGKERKMLNQLREGFSLVRKAKCLLLGSCYELEIQVMETLRASFPFPVYPVVPLIPKTTLTETPLDTVDYLQWLDSQPRRSVLYVSLGSFLSVSSEQMDEIMAGIRLSGVRYFWIAGGDTFRVQEACGEMGLVVPWCDQLRVLCHSSIGGFWTHCGWNSTMEGVFAGVPMLTFPISFDQVPNEKQIVDDWKIGVRVKEAGNELVIKSEEIAITMQIFMDLDSDENTERKKRVSELQETCRRALAKDGSSDTSLDDFIRKFLQCS
ncbi:hypothetical protein GIB67_038937 [Kingdonia uniflora]|uniref:Uncharacterized protein n=1 Tax=Kingdonia uniflora TaxID=39325 RepID=A0A7J7LQL5_9MAGN|nr:hypothetical protein GIB67_038937 [Kingdonia uniflora]